MQWHTQNGSIKINMKAKIYFTLPELSVTKIVTWIFHVNGSTWVRYDMILGRDLFTALGLNIKLSDYVIEPYYVYFQGSTAPVVGLVTYAFKNINTGNVTPAEFFTSSNAE